MLLEECAPIEKGCTQCLLSNDTTWHYNLQCSHAEVTAAAPTKAYPHHRVKTAREYTSRLQATRATGHCPEKSQAQHAGKQKHWRALWSMRRSRGLVLSRPPPSLCHPAPHITCTRKVVAGRGACCRTGRSPAGAAGLETGPEAGRRAGRRAAVQAATGELAGLRPRQARTAWGHRLPETGPPAPLSWWPAWLPGAGTLDRSKHRWL